MKSWKLIFFTLSGAFTAFALINSCRKDSNLNTYTFNAMIVNEGPLAGDGCDWVVIADSTYHPLNLDDQYKVNNSKITVTFHKGGSKFYCGILPLHLSEIIIDKITLN